MGSIASFWDTAADSFDQEPDHGLGAPDVRAAWSALLRMWMPADSVNVLDLGCGTGTLSLLLSEQGHRVTGVDLSPRMVERARAKLAAAGVEAQVMVGDAGDPPVGGDRFDVVLARHLLWTLPDPPAALWRWTELLRAGGRLILVEGRWDSAAAAGPYVEGAERMPWMGGATAETLAAAVAPIVSRFDIEPLTDPQLWGRIIRDERYAVIAHL